MITFWKNVACTGVLTAATVPHLPIFAPSARERLSPAQELQAFSPMCDPVQSQPLISDAERLSRLLELELVQKRAAWKQARERKKSLRSLAFLFLFLLFAACLLGFFFAFNRVNEERQNRPMATSNH